jgi:hypothetical protein
MSKGLSYLFNGTRGERQARAIMPSSQRNAVLNWANRLSAELSAKSKRQRDKFKTACVAVDDRTGNMYFGRNGGIGRDGAGLHPTLKKILPKVPLNNYPTPWNCAESDAINKALHAGAILSDIHIYTISTALHGSGDNKYGNGKKSCENCTAAFKGRIRRNNTGWTE